MIIREGECSANIALLQSTLRRLGYFSGRADGRCDADTLSALLNYRRQCACTEYCRELSVPQELYDRLRGYGKVRSGELSLAELCACFDTDEELILAANESPNGDLIIPERGFCIDTEALCGSALINLYADSLSARNYRLSRVDFGTSVLRRRLYALRFGSGISRVLIGGSHRGNETKRGMEVLSVLHRLLTAHAYDSDFGGISAEKLASEYTFSFVPLINPDGADIAAGELSMLTGAGQYAKSITKANAVFPGSYAANARGVELALNYEADEAEYTSASPSNVGYGGPYPLSEPETQAFAEYFRSFAPEIALLYGSDGYFLVSSEEASLFSEQLEPKTLIEAIRCRQG